MEKLFKTFKAAILISLLFALYAPTTGLSQTTSINGFRVVTSPGTVKPGESITFSWQAPSTHSTRDWVGLFLNFQPSSGSTTVKFKYVPSGTSGFLTITAPATQNGLTYQLRYFLNDGWTEADRSNLIAVSSTATAPTPPPPPPPPSPTTNTSTTSTSTTTPSTSPTGAVSTTPPPPPPATSTGGSCPNGAPLAFGGAEGFGRCAQGGRGGRTIDVTNLNNNGPGSLRQCAEVETGPRTCVLRMAGTISLGTYDITVKNDYLTIDGSAAPVTLKDGGLDVRASHTIIRHLRIRPGAKSWIERGMNANGITYRSTGSGGATHDHICDHCSVSWGTDDLIAVINGTYNVTIQDSILSEGLTNGPTCKNCGSRGLLVGTGNKETLSVIRTLNAHNFIRFPNATGGQIDFVNNVDYNGNGSSAQIAPYYGPVRINMVGNYWKDGPSGIPFNLTYNVIRTIGGMAYSPQSGIYVLDNVGRSRQTGTAPETAIIWGDNGGIPVQSVRYPYPQVTTMTALQAYEQVLNGSGAQPRDSVDARVVTDVRNGTGMIISDPAQVGGWPVLSGGTP
ncbi:MAG: hypothetical protein E6R14_04930 [Thermomicrobiales bacterium]|nr:MAG: hypothetical protein E6R14_04930 [Thermomicrobiales bacterium]